MEGECIYKNSESPCFSLSLRLLPTLITCSSSPGDREPISVASLLNLPRKKGAVMQETIVNHGKPKMGKMVRRRKLPYVRRLISFHRGRVVRNAVLMSMEREKVMKNQRRSKEMD
jgi:hypothetical protein